MRFAKHLAAAFAAIGFYFVVAWATFGAGGLPVRPLFDGPHTLQPYQWVDPPDDLAAGNVPPQKGSGQVRLTKNGSQGNGFFTNDLQAQISIPKNVFKPRGGERFVDVTLEPLDPDELGAAPEGLEYQGNAYAIGATYAGSRKRAVLTPTDCVQQKRAFTCVTIIMRTPFGASDMARWDGKTWTLLGGNEAGGADIYADSDELGTFAAVAEPGQRERQQQFGSPGGGSNLGNIIAIVLGMLAAGGATVAYVAQRKARARERMRQRAAGKKYKAPAEKRKGPSNPH
jgi:hypothetical protein